MLLLLPIATASCVSEPLSPEEEFAAAGRAAEAWVQKHPNGWALALETGRAPARPQGSEPCSGNPDSGFTTLQLRDRGLDVLLLFRCPVDGSASPTELSSSLAYIVLDELPHGISSRGWTFAVMTPASSIQDGIGLTAPSAGRMRLSVDTPLYAVRGLSTRADCQPPADGPSPPGCHLTREHGIPLALSVTFPFTGSLLD